MNKRQRKKRDKKRRARRAASSGRCFGQGLVEQCLAVDLQYEQLKSMLRQWEG